MSFETVLNSEDIKKLIPHRYPFLLIDKVVERIQPESESRVGRKVVAIKNVTANEDFFNGHFPGQPVMPGVLIVESMAQAGAIASHRDGEKPMQVAIAKINESRFRQPVVPGDTLVITAEVTKDRGKIIAIACEARVDGKLVADTSIIAHVSF